MAFVFKPAIYQSSTLFELPRPIVRLRVQDSWDAEDFKVPLADGDTLVGHSRQGVNISINGEIGSRAGAVKSSEEEMFSEIESLRAKLNVDDADDKYDLFIYHDSGSATYRSFHDCTTLRFDFDLSNQNLFTYSVVVHAEDPTIYTSAPG